MAFSLKKSESILLQKNNHACRQVCDRHSLKCQMYRFLYTLAMLLNLYSTSGCFSSKSEAGNLLLPYKYFPAGMPSAYEKCCAVVEESTVKGCACCHVGGKLFGQSLILLYPPQTSPQKNLGTEFWETKESLEGQMSAKHLLFEQFKKSLWGKAVQQPCR